VRFMVLLVLLWVIPDSGPSLSRWDRVSLIVSTRWGERLPVLRSGVSGVRCRYPWSLWSAHPIRVPMRFVRLHLRRILLGLPVPRAGGWVIASDWVHSSIGGFWPQAIF